MEDRDVTLDNGWGPFPVALGSVPEANKMVAAGKAGEIFLKKQTSESWSIISPRTVIWQGRKIASRIREEIIYIPPHFIPNKYHQALFAIVLILLVILILLLSYPGL